MRRLSLLALVLTSAAHAGGAAPPASARPPLPMTLTGAPGSTVATVSPGAQIQFGSTTPGSGCSMGWDGTASAMVFACAVATGSERTTYVALPPSALPACAAAEANRVRVASDTGALVYCSGAGGSWAELVNAPAQPAPIIVAFTPTATLGILGLLGTATQTVAVTGATVGAHCQASCPATVLAKVIPSCSVDTAGTATVTYSAKVTVSITLGGTCSLLAFNR